MSSKLSVFLLAAVLSLIGFSGASRAQTCPANIAHVTGVWDVLPYRMPVNPISANLLPNGKVLIVSGSENTAPNNTPGAQSYRGAVLDLNATAGNNIVAQNVNYDIFCSATAQLPDGRSLVVGGTSDYTFTGEARSSFFDWLSGQFVQSQTMAEGRWYASAIALADGRIMAMSGLTTTGATSKTVEIYDLNNAGAGWRAPTTVPFTPPLYPRIVLVPGGKVFYTGQGSGGSSANSWFFDPSTGTWTASAAVTLSRSYGAATMLPLLPPGYTPRVMNFGGNSPATKTTELIDLSAASPAWTAGPNMSTGRIEMHSILLPNGKVLASGGSVSNNVPDTAGRTADMYDPVSNTFSSAGTAAFARLYHSTALLLPDARVLSMGSNPGARGQFEPVMEIYSPPYLFDANDHPVTNRPAITALSSTSMGYNSSFTVSFSSASPIASAVLMRLGASTHSYEMEQRMIGLCGASPQPACNGSNNALTLTTPPNGSIAPPGYYMLFLLDSAGVPSVAQFIHITPYSTVPPSGSIGSPSTDVTITAGSTVSFGTGTSASKYSWVFPGGTPGTSTAQNPGSVTFPNPGVYTVSMTAIDSSGNSDPHPPTRTVTVLPASPDFNISVTPSAGEVTPGGLATYTVKVSPLSGFTGAVSLSVASESGFPTGVSTSGFSPASISGSGTSTLTMATTTSAAPFAVQLTITGTSGSLTHTASTTLTIRLNPPSSVSASAGDKQVSLSWPGVTGAAAYQVGRADANGGPYRTLACPATTSFVDQGLVDGTTYFYVVSGMSTSGPNAGGTSPVSPQSSATPQATALAAPTNLTATAGSGQIGLAWTASSGATGYRVKRAPVSGGPYTTIGNPTSASFTDTTVTSGTTYYYVVSAVNATTESPNSAQVSATPTATTTAGSETLFTTQTPVYPNKTDGGTAYELGMKFQLARAGTITAIRYYKSSSDSGTHVGRIWSSTGTQLATVTFTGETSSGWQQQALATPLTVQAGTVYTVSVNIATNYPQTFNGLATSIVNGDVSSVADGNNGVFGTPGTQPTQSYQNSNYFRDVVFVPSSTATTTESLFTTQAPAAPNKTDGVPYELGMKFQLARAGTITGIRYYKSSSDSGTHVGRIWSSSGSLLASVTFANETASGWQQQALASPLTVQSGTVYTVSVNIASNYPQTTNGLATSVVNGDIGSVADGNNGVFGTPGTLPTQSYQNSNYFRDIVFVPGSAPSNETLFSTQVPAAPNKTDGVPYELGMKFKLARSGNITAIRYYKSSSDSGTHVGRIWSSTGTQLASVTFANETASGWQQQALSTPLAVQSGVVYTVSVNIASNYPQTVSGLATSIVNADISSVADGNNGVWGNPFSFPTSSYQNSNYFRDIVFTPGP